MIDKCVFHETFLMMLKIESMFNNGDHGEVSYFEVSKIEVEGYKESFFYSILPSDIDCNSQEGNSYEEVNFTELKA